MAYVVIRDPRTAQPNQPTRLYDAPAPAEAEAKRLAECNRGVLFCVAEIISGAILPAPEAVVTDYRENPSADPFSDDIPF